jgi:Phycobilisome protein
MASAFPPRAQELIGLQLAQPIYDLSGPCAAAQLAVPPRFLTDDECEALYAGGTAARMLRDNKDGIVRAAQAGITERHPGIREQGGGLWPQFRADACWRDMENFTRVASYGCVGDEQYLNEEGCVLMDDIYDCLEVPRDAMLTGIKAAAAEATRIAKEQGDDEVVARVETSFKALVGVLAAMVR